MEQPRRRQDIPDNEWKYWGTIGAGWIDVTTLTDTERMYIRSPLGPLGPAFLDGDYTGVGSAD